MFENLTEEDLIKRDEVLKEVAFESFGGKSVGLNDLKYDIYKLLEVEGYLAVSFGGLGSDPIFELTQKGRDLLSEGGHIGRLKLHMENKKLEELQYEKLLREVSALKKQYWQWWITTAIALAALAISILD